MLIASESRSKINDEFHAVTESDGKIDLEVWRKEHRQLLLVFVNHHSSRPLIIQIIYRLETALHLLVSHDKKFCALQFK